ncbi:MAG: hypothetical protein QOI85_645 [Chloroflexota bacterium]|jgi:hypothetical protein|nr:hypothetical protein [Chloroflexota bacterium]
MDSLGDTFGGLSAVRQVEIDLLTDAYRITGTLHTRFGRVTDILNQLAAEHLSIERATITEHADPSSPLAAPTAIVPVASILLLAAPDLTGVASSDMRIQKRPVKAMFALPPVRIIGTTHVPMGSRPLDGLLNVTDRFLAITEVTIASAAFPHLASAVEAAAVSRAKAQILLVTDDERPDELLADVLDERTAEAWLRSDEAQR